MPFGNLKYRTQLPGFESFTTQLPGGSTGRTEVHERGGSEEPAAWTALRASQADPLGAGAKAELARKKKLMMDPYEALYAMELEGL